jgi:hypothetical protein
MSIYVNWYILSRNASNSARFYHSPQYNRLWDNIGFAALHPAANPQNMAKEEY